MNREPTFLPVEPPPRAHACTMGRARPWQGGHSARALSPVFSTLSRDLQPAEVSRRPDEEQQEEAKRPKSPEREDEQQAEQPGSGGEGGEEEEREMPSFKFGMTEEIQKGMDCARRQ